MISFAKVSSAAILLAITTVFACGDESERQEQLTRLRGVGLSTAPLVEQPSVGTTIRSVVVTAVVTTPPGQTITATPFRDDQVQGAFMAPVESISIDTAAPETKDFQNFALHTFKATVAVPDIQLLQGPAPAFTGTQVRYGFEVRTADDVEYVTGSFLVYPEGAPELAWQDGLQVAIDAPSDGATVAPGAKVSIAGTVSNPNEEDVKFGWFVTDGKVQNRRALDTEWTAPETPGSYTLIVTARGRRSRSFAYTPITVTVN